MKELSPTDKSKGCKLTETGLLEASFTQRSPSSRFRYKKRMLMYTNPLCVCVRSDSKGSACNAEDLGSIPRLGRCSGGGHGNPLQYSCLENPRDRGAWQVAVHGVAKSWTRLSD